MKQRMLNAQAKKKKILKSKTVIAIRRANKRNLFELFISSVQQCFCLVG